VGFFLSHYFAILIFFFYTIAAKCLFFVLKDIFENIVAANAGLDMILEDNYGIFDQKKNSSPIIFVHYFTSSYW